MGRVFLMTTTPCSALSSATAEQAAAVGATAYIYSRLTDSAAAFSRARDSSIGQLAARAGFNLGVTLGQLGRADDALSAYQRVIDTYADDPDPETREAVARAASSLNRARSR